MTTTGKYVKTVAISVSSSGDNEIVAAVSEKRIKVTSFSIQGTGTVNVKFKDGSTDLTGAYNFQVREGIAMGLPAPAFLFATSRGSALNLNLSGAVSVVGHVSYFDEDRV